jgi:hypothetical protein
MGMVYRWGWGFDECKGNVGDEDPTTGRGRGKFLSTIYESALYSKSHKGIAMDIMSSDMDGIWWTEKSTHDN